MQQITEFVINNWLLVLAFVVILLLLARTFVSSGGMKNVAPAEAIRILNSGEGLLLDVRSEKEYEEGHILNSINIPLGLLVNRISEVAKYKDKPIVFCCRSGNRSSQAAATLRKQGFTELYNVAGGLMAWQGANLPIAKKSKKQGSKKDKVKKDNT